MAKKKLKYFIPGAIALVLGIAACCMMFLKAVQFTAEGSIVSVDLHSYTGMQLAFGYTETHGEGIISVSTKILSFNVFAMLAFMLPLIGGVLALIFKNGLIGKIITTACFVVAAVLLFSIVGYAKMGMSAAEQDAVELFKGSLGAGPIVAAILSIFGAAVCFFKGTIAKMFK